MCKFEKLNSSLNFRSVLDEGRKIVLPQVVLVYSRFGDPDSKKIKFGIIASRKVGNAVKRNRCKRVLRVAIRNAATYSECYGIELVAIARKRLVETKSNVLEKILCYEFYEIKKNTKTYTSKIHNCN